MTQLPPFSDLGPSSMDSVHLPSLPCPRHLPFRKGVVVRGEMCLASTPAVTVVVVR